MNDPKKNQHTHKNSLKIDLDVRSTRYIYYTYTTVTYIINYQRTVKNVVQLLGSLVLV